MNPKKILIVEDEYITGADLRNAIAGMGYEVTGIADTGEDAIRMAREQRPDLVLMDITLKGEMTGIGAAKEIHAHLNIPILFLTAHSDDGTVGEAALSEPFGYLVKPVDERALRTSVAMALFRHAAEERQRRSELTIRALLNATRDEAALVDGDGKILVLNEAFARSAGRSTEDLTGAVIYELIAKGGLSMKAAEELRMITAKGPVSFSEETRGRWLDTTIYPLPGGADGSRQTALFRHDITPEKKLEEELANTARILGNEKQRLATYANALDNLSDCVIITDATGGIVCANRTFLKVFATTRDAVKGKHFSTLAHAENRYPVSPDDFLQYQESDSISVFVARNAYGIRMPMTLKSRPLSVVNGRPGNFIFVLREKLA